MPSPLGPSSPVIWPGQITPNTPIPGTSTGGWPGPGPNQILCGTSATSVSLASDSSIANQSSTSYAYDPPSSASKVIAERVDDLLKSNYKGSSLGTVDVKIS